MTSIPVHAIMSRDLVTVRQDALVCDAVTLMKRHRRPTLPVVDDAGHLVGVVSEHDLFLQEKGVPFSLERIPALAGHFVGRRGLGRVAAAKRCRVRQIMTAPPVTVDENTSVEELAMLMYERRLSCLPVVQGARLTGLVSQTDVLEVLYAPEADLEVLRRTA